MLEIQNKRQLAQGRVMTATILAYASYHIVKLNLTQASPTLIANEGFTKAQIGLLLAILGISYGSSKFVLGIIADRIRPRLLISMGLILSSISDLFLGQTQNHLVMAVLVAMIGLMQGCGAPACQKLIAGWFSRKQLGTAISCWHTSHNIGAGSSAVVVALVIMTFGANDISNIFLIPAIVSIVMAILVYYLGVDAPEKERVASGQQYDFWHDFFEKLIKNHLMWVLGFLNALSYILRYGIENWLPTYLQLTKKFSATQTATAFAWFEYAAIPGTILLGLVSDRLLHGRRMPLVIATSLAMLISLPIYMILANQILVNTVVAIMGICVYGQQTLLDLIVLDIIPLRYTASGVGMLGFFGYAFGQVIASYGIGTVVDKTNWHWAFLIIFLAGTICVLVFGKLEFKFNHLL